MGLELVLDLTRCLLVYFFFLLIKQGVRGGGGGDKARFVFVLFSDCALITAGWRVLSVALWI